MSAPAVNVRLRDAAGRAEVFERVEWVVELDREYGNPFDPDEIAVDAKFVSPSGRTMVVPGFWYQAHRRETDGGRERIVAEGKAMWLVRFAATEAGTWRMVVSARDKTGVGESAAEAFAVAAGKGKGFVRRAAGNSRYFQFDSGEAYFMVGMNLGWAGRSGLGDYERWISRMGEVGANFARMWMSRPGRPIETKGSGIGRYDLGAGWYFDRVLETAEKHGVYCMLAFGTYGELIDGGHFGEGQWSSNPYNAANGGPATQPVDVFTHEKAKELYKRRLRYLIARYSAFTSMAFWEFWNEQDNAKLTVPAEWVREMARYLKANDPYRHLVTTSYAGMGQPGVWKMEEIDLTQRHMYGDGDSLFDAVPAIAGNTRTHDGYGKPHLLGEYGISWRGPDNEFDPKGVGTNFHNALWAAALSGAAGSGCHWWWDSYVDPKGLYSHFGALAKFVAKVDWPRRKFEPVEVLSPTWMKVENEAFVDVTIPTENRWGKSDGRMRELRVDGSCSGALPGILFGSEKAEMRGRTTIKVSLPGASRMIVRALKVSNYANVRVFVDDKPVVDWAFSALPGAAGQEKTEMPKEHQVYQATFNKDYSVEIPAGEHRISWDCIAGDWVSIGAVTFTNARSSRYTGLRVYAMSDGESGEMVAWVQDPASHVGADREGMELRRFEGAEMALPAKAGTYRVQWWDTRRGQVVGSEAVKVEGGMMRVAIPGFARDIAMRVWPQINADERR